MAKVDSDIEGDFRVGLSHFSGFILVAAALARLRCRVEHSVLGDRFSYNLPIKARRPLCVYGVSVLLESVTVDFSYITLS